MNYYHSNYLTMDVRMSFTIYSPNEPFNCALYLYVHSLRNTILWSHHDSQKCCYWPM